MSLGKKLKDPGETRTFTFDWSVHIGSDTIATSVWAALTGITKVADGIAAGAKATNIKLSGGTDGTDHTITNTVTLTTSGEILERSAVIAVRER